MTATAFLPYGRHSVDEDDIAAVAAVLRGDWLTTGPTVRAFEQALARRVGAADAVSCSSGTAALHLAALALGLGEGDVAVVPAITFLATANAVRFVGAEVAFADVDPETGLMGPQHVEAALAQVGGGRARAVFPVHLAGQTADPVGLRALADRHGLAVVEDACHALGTRYRGAPGDADVPVGACRHADMAVFSFHPVKTIAMGEGGAVTAADPDRAARVRRLACHGMVRDPACFVQPELAVAPDGSPNPWYYEMPEIGFNYRASDIHCALALSQLNKLDRFVAERRSLADLYRRALEPLAPLVRPLGRVPGSTPGWHLCVALVDFAAAGVSRDAVMRHLREAGIGTQVHYIPVHLQPYYRRRYGTRHLPGAESYYRRTLSLPLFPGMTADDVTYVVATLAEALAGAQRRSLRRQA